MPLSQIATFKAGGLAQIPSTGAGNVLTDNGPSSAPTFQAPGVSGGTNAGPSATAVLAAGANNNFNPGGGWPTGIGRLILNSSAGIANITGLVAGTDGQQIEIVNALAGASQVTLNSQNAGSAAANRFVYVGDLVLSVNGSVRATYYGAATGMNAGNGGWVLNV